ncbi:MAG: hypothetical protein ACOC1L_02720 [Bacillota bacterium]
MIKKMSFFLLVFIYILIGFTSFNTVNADSDKEIVYFYDPFCSGCQALEAYGLFDALEDDGIVIREYDITRRKNIPYYNAFVDTYDIPGGTATPLIIAGDTFYLNEDDIIDAYEDGSLLLNASSPLLDVSETPPREYSFISALLLIIGGGLLDGINPCAIAMLLLFISMVGFAKNRKTLLIIGVSYIGAIFLTYFTLGIGILHLGFLIGATIYLNIGFTVLFTLLFILTFYDFLVTRQLNYGKVKNQLPKLVKAFNKNVMERFAKIIEDENGGFKRIILIVVIPFVIGIIVGVTEAACTGQVYLGVLGSIIANNPGSTITSLELFYILIFNIMFIVPLIIILIIAIKTKSVMGVSNFIREHLSLIKLITSLFFLFMVIYFALQVFNINLFKSIGDIL